MELFWSGANAFWNIHKRRFVKDSMATSSDYPEWLKSSGLELEGLCENDSGWIINSYMKRLRRHVRNASDLARMSYSEFRLRLPELLLMRVDKIGMSTSIEGRVPFLDHKSVELTRDIPQEWQIRNGESKYLLKLALADLLPDNILYREKMGFAAPMAQWLRGDFGQRAQSAVLASPLMNKGLLNHDYIEQKFRDHIEGRQDNALHLWTLFNLTSWYDHWIADH